MASANTSNDQEKSSYRKPCRACVDFKTWAKTQGTATNNSSVSEKSPSNTECPVDSVMLGNATWTYLHTMAAYYPDSPTTTQQKDMSSLISNFSKFYPCDYCSEHMREWLIDHPPETQTRSKLCLWMCTMHNDVNQRLGKPLFDCSKVDERWLTGGKDGSCD